MQPPAAGPFRAARNLRLFYLLSFVREFTPLLAIWVVYLTDYRHLTLAQVGAMEALFWLVKLAAEIPSGAFADRYGRRASMIAGVVLEGSGLLLFGFASDFVILTLSYVVWGSGFAFRSGSSEAYLYDALQAEGRSGEYTDRMGLYWALDTGGAVLGGIAGGLLAVAFNLQVAVLVTFGSYALALPLLLLMQEPPRTLSSQRRGYRQILREGLDVIRVNAGLRNMVFLQIALMSSFAGFGVLGQPFMSQHDVPLSLFGVLSAPVMLATAAAGLFSGRLVRAVGVARALAGAVVGVVLGMAVLAVFDHVAAFAGFALSAAAVGLVQPAAVAYVSDRTDSAVRATVLSLGPFGESVAIAVANSGAGVLGDVSLRLAFAALAAGVGLGAVVSYAAWRAADRAAAAVQPAGGLDG